MLVSTFPSSSFLPLHLLHFTIPLTYLTPPSFPDLTKAPSADDNDPKHLRAYGELGKLKKLADLMERPCPPAGSEVWLRVGVGV